MHGGPEEALVAKHFKRQSKVEVLVVHEVERHWSDTVRLTSMHSLESGGERLDCSNLELQGAWVGIFVYPSSLSVCLGFFQWVKLLEQLAATAIESRNGNKKMTNWKPFHQWEEEITCVKRPENTPHFHDCGLAHCSGACEILLNKYRKSE